MANEAFNLSWSKKEGDIEVFEAGSHANLLANFKGSIMKFWD